MRRATILHGAFAVTACFAMTGCGESSAKVAKGTDDSKPIKRVAPRSPGFIQSLLYATELESLPPRHTETYLHPEAPASFEERLKLIASEYLKYPLANQEARLAPRLCAPPPLDSPSFSSGGDPETHGRKLYYLFIADPRSYWPTGKSVIPIGQALVKESWTAEPAIEDVSPKNAKHACGEYVKQYAQDGEAIYRVGEKQSLFIMFKLNPKTPGTDEGWVYGTVSADGKTVTSAGRVESCMKCHQQAPHDRLFGLKQD